MTPQEINAAIAESLGWHHFIINDEYGCDRALRPDDKFVMGCFFTDIPNYTADLNAMHEVWCNLTSKQHFIFRSYLQTIVLNAQESGVLPSGPAHSVCNATAAQRAEAYLRTIGKWKD